MIRKIKTALISVYNKEGLEDIIRKLHELNISIYTTGGTQIFIESLGVAVHRVEDLTGYPSILGGRVKTLHPKVFGGILAIREEDHLNQLEEYSIPAIDLVIVDLYPFEETVLNTSDESAIIEKIDIGGISLIRAAAKNFRDVIVVPSQDSYSELYHILCINNAESNLSQRRDFAWKAFNISSNYDCAIFKYLSNDSGNSEVFKKSISPASELRYGENPHQKSSFYGKMEDVFTKLCGKDLSYNNLVDVDAAISLMKEFRNDGPTFAILKHTNTCGISTRNTVKEAWLGALAADPISAFGGILISNHEINLEVAIEIDMLFYEVLIAPSYSTDAKVLLSKKSNRVLLQLKEYIIQPKMFKSLLNGVIVQDADEKTEQEDNFVVRTKLSPSVSEIKDLIFAGKCAKHLKSNTIVLVKNNQLLGMGCGQTSRIDACRYAIEKAKYFNFDLSGAVMASDAFFPFPDCVELVYKEGIRSVVQPGGSIKDQLSIDFCDVHGMSMVFTGYRHFKH